MATLGNMLCGFRVTEKAIVDWVGGGIGAVEEFSFTRFKFWYLEH